MSDLAWFEGVASVEVAGPDEAPDDHRLVWAAGELSLSAHPDPEAEQALGALGGERCACLDVLAAWDATHADGAVLTVGARGPDDVVRPPVEAVLELRADLRRWRATSGSLVEEARLSRDTNAIDRLVSVAGPAERVAARRLGFLLLLGLDPALLWRLQASVAAGFVGRPERSAQLTAATAARALPVLAALGWWTGSLRDVGLGPSASVSSSAVVLPPTWVASVWGRGLAGASSGELVVDVTSVTPAGEFGVVVAAPGKAQMARVVAPGGE